MKAPESRRVRRPFNTPTERMQVASSSVTRGAKVADKTSPTAPESAAGSSNFRCQRGLAIFKKHARSIRRIAPWTYAVPSQSGSGVYVVYMKAGEECCSCPDYARRHEPDEEGWETFFCKHYYAARLWRARSEECAGCKGHFPSRTMVEVGEGHLTFYADDYLCKSCVGKHGLGDAA